jgi:hypothetical protein
MDSTLVQIISSIIAGLAVIGLTSSAFIIKKNNNNYNQDMRDINQKLDRNHDKSIESNIYLKEINQTLKQNGQLLQEILRSKWN